MKNSTIISLVISGLVIALIGIGLDYQRRVESRERYDAWRLADHQRRMDEKRKSDAAMAAVDRSIEDLARASADSLKKLEESKAKREADEMLKRQADLWKGIVGPEVQAAAEDALEKASAESERRLLGTEN